MLRKLLFVGLLTVGAMEVGAYTWCNMQTCSCGAGQKNHAKCYISFVQSGGKTLSTCKDWCGD